MNSRHVIALLFSMFAVGCTGTDSVSDTLEEQDADGILFVQDSVVLNDDEEDTLFHEGVKKDFNIDAVIHQSSEKDSAKSSSSKVSRSSSSKEVRSSSAKESSSSLTKEAASSSGKTSSSSKKASSSSVAQSSSSKAMPVSSSSSAPAKVSSSSQYSSTARVKGSCTTESSVAHPGNFVRWEFVFASGFDKNDYEYSWKDTYGYNSESMDHTLETVNNFAEFSYTAKNTGMNVAPQVTVRTNSASYVFLCNKVEIVAAVDDNPKVCGTCLASADTAYAYEDVWWKFVPGEGCVTDGYVEWINLDATRGGYATEVDSVTMMFSKVSGNVSPLLTVYDVEISCPAITIVAPPDLSSSSVEPESSETKSPSIYYDGREHIYCEALMMYVTEEDCKSYMNQ